MSEKIVYREVYFTSLEDVEQDIKRDDLDKVCNSMPAIGMECEYDEKVKQLIENCLKSKEEWIRRAGLMCLYHLHYRFKTDICDDDFMRFMQLGIQDDNKVVIDIIDSIMSDLKMFSPNIYKNLENRHN